MVVWYIVSTIFLVIGTVMVIWGVYLMFCGVRYEDPRGDFFRGVQKWSFAIFLELLLWAVGFPWGGEYFEWLKMFVVENAVVLRIIAGVLFPMISLPLIFFFVYLIKWLFIDTRKKVNKTFSEDDKESER